MKLNNYWYAIIILVAICLGEFTYILYQNSEISKREKENLVHEGKDIVFREMAEVERRKSNALIHVIHINDSIRELHNNDEQIIIHKYEPQINSFKYMPANRAIQFLAKRLSEDAGTKR